LDIFVQAQLLKHKQVVYLGIMPPYFSHITDRRQLQTWEVLTLEAKIQSFPVNTAIVSYTENIHMRSPLLRSATVTDTTEFINGEVRPFGLFLNNHLISANTLFIRGATKAAIATRRYHL
jgi:hypothetical protein